MDEIWREIKGYEGLYEVSSLGRVKSVNRNHIMNPVESRGYLKIGLCKDRKKKMFRVHRLVADAFIPNDEDKPEVDHIDGDRKNNKVDNLRWATHKENNNNPVTIERKRYCFNHKTCLGKHWIVVNNKRVWN